MFRGIVIGSLALIVLYVGLQPGSAGAVSEGAGIFTGFLNRLLSSDVAGVPQRAS
jgi:hypothetical protein